MALFMLDALSLQNNKVIFVLIIDAFFAIKNMWHFPHIYAYLHTSKTFYIFFSYERHTHHYLLFLKLSLPTISCNLKSMLFIFVTL